MEVDFWHRKWREGEIGFHQETVNPFLRQYWPRLEPPGQVFAPLCGKSGDMAWLAACGQGVLGIEISALAIEAFFRENALPCTREEGDPFTIWRGANIEILQGDFFHLEAGHLAQVQAVYDRAAMIALPPALRRLG
ncbi:MAG: thiopurine S-methyltransferase, partial [Gammaproteobacteria bacterium]